MTHKHLTQRTVRALIVALMLTPPALSLSKTELAAKHYGAASQLYEDLLQVPSLELRVQQYELVISAFQIVHRTDPTSGYCDDALVTIAELYREMSRRFGEDKYRLKAIEAYRFASREYPHSKHSPNALAMAERLTHQKASGSPASGKPAEEDPARGGSERLALSDSGHPAGVIVEPTGPTALGPGLAVISEIRHHSYEDGTRVVLNMSGQTALKYDTLENPKRLYIDLFGSRIANVLIQGVKADIQDSLLASARLAQNRRNKARLVLDLKRAVAFDVFWLANPTRCVLDLRAAGTHRLPRTLQALDPGRFQPPAPKAADTTADGRHSLVRALGLKLDRILIDAGHGGHDTGSVGPSGLREKDVVLEISRRLGTLLRERLGAEVIYTRESDLFVPLEERARIANERQADLMLSIHCNSAPNTNVRGVETYYLNFTSDSWELSVASLENAAANRSLHELEDLVAKIALEERIEEAREFATRIQHQLYSGVARHSSSIRDRGIRKAPFIVLIGAEMPAVLRGDRFHQQPQDETLMRKSSFREEVAEHLFDGIAAYAESLGVITMGRSLAPGSSQRD